MTCFITSNRLGNQGLPEALARAAQGATDILFRYPEMTYEDINLPYLLH
uniref:Glycosyltransferase family 1 protein n=1 Tax=Heterorhabditis bacteriophora TaxID=37862 RepID=A0A1I7WIW8_HETBA